MASFLSEVSFQLEVPVPPPKDRASTALCDAEDRSGLLHPERKSDPRIELIQRFLEDSGESQ